MRNKNDIMTVQQLLVLLSKVKNPESTTLCVEFLGECDVISNIEIFKGETEQEIILKATTTKSTTFKQYLKSQSAYQAFVRNYKECQAKAYNLTMYHRPIILQVQLH